MSASLLDVDDLIEFIDELRLAGYDISTQQYIDAQNLLIALAANGHLPSDPKALHTWLAPVFCSSPREQGNFYRRFDRWITQHPRLMATEPATEPLGGTPRALVEDSGKAWYRSFVQVKFLLPLVALLLITGGLLFLLPRIPRTVSGKIVDDDSKEPLANARVSFVGKTSVSDNQGGFAISYRLNQLPATLTVDYPEYESATLLVNAANKSPVLLSLQKPGPPPEVSPSPDVKPTVAVPTPVVTPIAKPIPTAVPIPSPVQPGGRNYLRWVRLGGAMFPLFLFGLWWLWKRKLSRALLQKLQSANQPQLNQIVVKGAAGQLFLGQSFRRTIQELRRHRQRGASELDAHRTVQRTIQRGGLFSPLYGARQTLPEYLILIDRASFQDQQARLEDEIIRRLVQDNVFVDSYYFQGDPRLCRKQEKDAPFVTLQEIAALHPDHHLIIFSDGSTFLNPLTGQGERWLEMFTPWATRALLTPELPAQWGYREWALSELEFIVLPATKEGLAALTEVIDGGASPRMDRDKRTRLFPAMLRERPRRWLENHKPQPDVARRLCDQLKFFLGSKGYAWLSACAVYPILYWDLTLYLGFKLFRDRSEIEDRLLSLVRLPWFRYGTIPDWLRLRLISELAPEDESTIRRTLEELFLTVLRQPAEGIRLDIVSDKEASGRGLSGLWQRLRDRFTEWKFKRFFWQFLNDESPESPLRDYVFLSFMSGRKPRKLTLSVPDSVRRLFFPQGQIALGMRPVGALVLAALCSLSLFFITRPSTQAGPAGGDDPTASPSPVRLYADMSAAEQKQFVQDRVQQISAAWGSGSDIISDEGINLIKQDVDAYAGRVGNNSTALGSEDLRTVLARGTQYAPTIIAAFNGRKVPPILGLYTTMVETEFRNLASENANGGAGLFQFTSATARQYGVAPSERTNVDKMAPAAASYVADRIARFGSDSAGLTLVILSCTRDLDTINKDIQRVGVIRPSFWVLLANADKLDQRFQRQDVNYVPKFFAAAIIGENPQSFGLQMTPLSSYAAVATEDRMRIITTSEDATARVWDVATGQTVQELKGHTASVRSAAFSPDGRWVVTASMDATARVWDAATGQTVQELKGPFGAVVFSAVFSPDSKWVLTAHADLTARVWEVATGRTVQELRGHLGPVYSAVFSPDGKRVLAASADGTARIWEAATGRTMQELKGHLGRVTSAVFSPDGERVLTAGDDRTARVWEAATGQQVQELKGHTDFVVNATFSPDGKEVLTASLDKTARVWEAATGRMLLELKGHTDVVGDAVFSPDGKWVVTVSKDKTARLWEVPTGRTVHVLKGHTASVTSAAFRPDGRWVVTASEDGTARVWGVASGNMVQELKGHTGPVSSAVFSPMASGVESPPSSDIDKQIADLIAEFPGPKRRDAIAGLVQLYEQNRITVVNALIDGLRSGGPESYRVNLYIAVTLGSIRPHWEGTTEQLAQIQALKSTANYQDTTFKTWVDQAINNYLSLP